MSRSRFIAASVALIAATPVAVWWVVGDLTEKGFPEPNLDYFIRPIDLPPVVEPLAGALAVMVVVVSVVVLALGLYHRQIDRRWLATVVPLCAAGAIVGAGWRVLTAGAIGANIGAGMVLIFGFPLAGLLVLGAALNWWRESRRR